MYKNNQPISFPLLEHGTENGDLEINAMYNNRLAVTFDWREIWRKLVATSHCRICHCLGL